MATTYRIKEDMLVVNKISLLKTDILNSPHHVFGDHTECGSLPYVCCIPKESEEAYGLYDDVVACLYRLINNYSSLLMNMNNNDAEHYNAVVCKFVGGTRVHFSRRESYENRCKAAAISFNQEEQYHI
ncbi:hypothetical protein QE152_g27448 [Popillia japonica]|uniref:Uncharacterized protein n=1 Tax=Popillia japonica TaxID=7064 RepID=A0AAW1JW74_POPJA